MCLPVPVSLSVSVSESESGSGSESGSDSMCVSVQMIALRADLEERVMECDIRAKERCPLSPLFP